MVHLTRLSDNVIDLIPSGHSPADPERGILEAYSFLICVGGQKAGTCELRTGSGERIRLTGHIAYTVYPAFRGHHYAARACALLKALAPSLGQRELFIAVRPFNLASKRTCELLKAEPCAEVPIPQGDPLYRSDQPYMLCYKLL